MGFNGMLKTISEYWFIIIAIIAFFHYYYKREMTKYETWQNKYFYKILVPFHLQYLKNLSIDIPVFINDSKLLDKAYVPSYLHYLARNESYANMINVMLVDYERNNPSPSNLSTRAQSKIMDVVFFCMDFIIILVLTLFIVLIALSVVFIVSEIVAFIQNGFWNVVLSGSNGNLQIFVYIITLIVFSIMTGTLLFFLNYINKSNYKNCYSSNRYKVEKLIAQKLKRFEKISVNLIYYSLPQNSMETENHSEENI